MAYTDSLTQQLYLAATTARENGERFFVARLYERSGGTISGQGHSAVLVQTAAGLAAVEAAGWHLVSANGSDNGSSTDYTLAVFRVDDR